MLPNLSKYKYKNKLALAMLLVTSSTLPIEASAVVTDLQINGLISQAIKTHPLVTSAEAEEIATQEGITAAKLNMLPTPSVSTSFDTTKDMVTKLAINQPLWTGGKLTANVNQAIYDDKAAVEKIYEQQNTVAKTTIEAWQGYIAAVEKQRVYHKSLEQLSQFEEMMKRRVSQGVSARIELELVSNRILQEQNANQAAIEQQRIAAARLEQIIGQPLPPNSASSVSSLGGLVEQARQQSVKFEQLAFNQASFYNPSVVKEYYQIESARQEAAAQRASRYPTVYAQYEHSYYHETEENDNNFYVGLSYNPGAGFSTLALTRASEARVNSLIANREAAQRSVMENIQVQYQQFSSALSREQSLMAAAAGADIVVSSYRRQFIAGRKSWLEVLNAVREQSDYEVQLAQTRSEILGSYYKLQVDFSQMPWQTFARNRQETKPFRVTDSVQEWLQKQDENDVAPDFGYGVSEPAAQVYDAETYVDISLPADAEEQLNNGAVLMISGEEAKAVTASIEQNSTGTMVNVSDADKAAKESDDTLVINVNNNDYEQDLSGLNTISNGTSNTQPSVDMITINAINPKEPVVIITPKNPPVEPKIDLSDEYSIDFSEEVESDIELETSFELVEETKNYLGLDLETEVKVIEDTELVLDLNPIKEPVPVFEVNDDYIYVAK